MNLRGKQVAIVGGGITGLTAALALSRLDAQVLLLEKSPFLGGHAVQFACKATDRCVKCGACLVEETLTQVTDHANTTVCTGATLEQVTRSNRFGLAYTRRPVYVDSVRCSGCGTCFEQCPVVGALVRGQPQNGIPNVILRRELCRYFDDASCSACRDACPETAIDLEQQPTQHTSKADAILVATGFRAYNPRDKAYGYDRFADVITNLELERMLRQEGRAFRPSDHRTPERLAFIQCVGSRDAALGHLWCSKVCCGSALRLAHLIKRRQATIDISFFYIDVQTFGKDFDAFYGHVRQDLHLIRSIPADIFEGQDGHLKVVYFDPQTHQPQEAPFDLVVLSVGLTPAQDNRPLADLLALPLAESGFVSADATPSQGIFSAGAAQGPMSIAESVRSAGQAAWTIACYLTNGFKALRYKRQP